MGRQKYLTRGILVVLVVRLRRSLFAESPAKTVNPIIYKVGNVPLLCSTQLYVEATTEEIEIPRFRKKKLFSLGVSTGAPSMRCKFQVLCFPFNINQYQNKNNTNQFCLAVNATASDFLDLPSMRRIFNSGQRLTPFPPPSAMSMLGMQGRPLERCLAVARVLNSGQRTMPFLPPSNLLTSEIHGQSLERLLSPPIVFNSREMRLPFPPPSNLSTSGIFDQPLERFLPPPSSLNSGLSVWSGRNPQPSTLPASEP